MDSIAEDNHQFVVDPLNEVPKEDFVSVLNRTLASGKCDWSPKDLLRYA